VKNNVKQKELAVPSSGPIPLQQMITDALAKKFPVLAVPSSGPIPLQRLKLDSRANAQFLLQYPLAGLFLYNPVEPISFRTPLVACSTL